MVQELERVKQSQQFPDSAPVANPVFFRTYSRKAAKRRESWAEVCDRTLAGLKQLGKLTDAEADLVDRMQRQLKSLTSGRWLWVGGTPWIEQPENFSGGYNCTSTNVIDWRAFGLMMDLAMQGCGTGAVLEPKYINQLPAVRNRLHITVKGEIGATPAAERRQNTDVEYNAAQNQATIYVGDSRQGWVKSYQTVLELSTDDRFTGDIHVTISISDVRASGEPLKGFGGMANPVKLPALYERCAVILNKAIGRQLTSIECCLLIDEAAVTIVAGNIRRCLPAGALVHSESGLVPIEKIRIGDRVLTSKGFYPVTNFFDQGEQELCRIKTQDGYFDCTPDHKVAVLEDVYGKYRMVKAKDLKEDDRLVFVPEAIPGTATELPEFKANLAPHAKRITIPALTTDVAYFIGYLHGDGSVGSDGWRVRFRISEDQQQIIDKLVNVGCLFGLVNHTLRTPEQSRAKAFELQFNSNALNQYLSQFKQAFTSITIPDCILLATKDIREAYLAGLADADGCFSQGVLVASIHADFLRQVQSLYASLGITTRLCSSIRKRTGKWEGELVTVGKRAFEQTNTLLSAYSLRYAHNHRERPKSFHDHGFPKVMVKPFVNTSQYHWGAVHKQMIVPTLKKYIPESTDLIPIKVKSVELNIGIAHTYDIEVASIHEFVCEGILVSNSAGMRQGDSNDTLFAGAKENLWQQDAEGNWRIDPERDALRMANHTRVFHRKPTLEECVEAVRKQYYSGEGAIQWAGEIIARSSADILSTETLKREFIAVYEQGEESARTWIKEHHPDMPDREIEHRLQRYGLNPCLTKDTWVHTEKGARQLKDLIGKQQSLYVNGELFSTTPKGFFFTGVKPVLKLQTKEGYTLKLTGNHQLLKVTAQTQKSQYTEWVEAEALQPGDRILLHNHRGLQAWLGEGTFEEGWLLGNLIGDGCLSESEANYSHQAKLRYWGETQEVMKTYALTLSQSIENAKPAKGFYHPQNKYYEIGSAALFQLATRYGITREGKTITAKVEEASHDFYRGFLRGLFDADGSVQGTQEKGTSIRLAQSNLATLEAVQRMLLRLGITSAIYQNRRQAGLRFMPDSHRQLKEYWCQAQHELVIANDNLPVFAETIGFQDPLKAERLEHLLAGYKRNLNRDRFTATITAIHPDGVEPVYDCTVPSVHRFDANGLVVHNCGEISGADFHCVAGDTILITREGMHPIQEIAGQSVEVWNGKQWSKVVPALTGQNRQLHRVRFSDGTYLDVTEKHRFFVKDRFGKSYEEVTTVELRDRLKTSKYALHTEPFKIDYQDGKFVDPVKAYTLGQLVGDGSVCRSNGKPQLQLRLYGLKSQQKQLTIAGKTSGTERYYTESKQTPCLLYVGFQENFDPEHVRALKNTANDFNEISNWNREAILHFVAGLADADGSEVPSGGIRIYISDYDRAYRVYLLLLKCGIRSSINLLAKAGAKTNLGVRRKDLWYLQITDCAAIPCQRLCVASGHHPRFKGKWQVIDSVEELEGLHDTFCFNEPEFHKGVFGGTLTGQCNLAEVHLNQLDPSNQQEQEEAFTAGAISVAALLNHKFQEPRYQYSRELDPIVGVSFTGLFDFFVKAFGVEWLRWWEAGRPDTVQGLDFKQREAEYLNRWQEIVHRVVWDYCDRHGIRRPNRCTTVQPSGTKSLLTGASPGWHPPKAQRFIRRITCRKNDPVALACVDYGYNIVPSQSDKDENGNLLNDPYDPRCTEWLVEIPVSTIWADLPGADEIEISKFSALAQTDFYMQVQKFYTRHNTSATIEVRENEIESLGTRIFEAIRDDEGYVSAALLARFDDLQTFPRLPFEPIDKQTYDRLQRDVKERRITNDFNEALRQYDTGEHLAEAGPAGCDSDKCMLPEEKPK